RLRLRRRPPTRSRRAAGLPPHPSMRPTYAEACARFSWRDSLAVLGWTSDGDVNLADTIVERHAASGRPALRWFGANGAERTLTFDELTRLANRVAGFLTASGVRKGDRMAGFLPRVPETLAIMLGTWKAGAVYVPIFTGFGPDAIAYRLAHGGAAVLCTHRDYRARVPSSLPGDVRIVTVMGDRAGDPPVDTVVGGRVATVAGALGAADTAPMMGAESG